MAIMQFKNRTDAGKKLAIQLQNSIRSKDMIVLALPRGGVPVAYEIANTLKVPLSVLVVRKLGAPFNPELAMGAIASGDTMYVDMTIVQSYGIPQEVVNTIADQERHELLAREKRYATGKKFSSLKGKTVIIVDDGIATGATMKAAVLSIKKRHAASIIVAVPVCPKKIYDDLTGDVDAIICLQAPVSFEAVGNYYESFPQVSDEQVINLLFTT